MLKLHTTVTDRATPVVLAISAAITPAQLNPIVGRAAVNVFRKHLFAQDAAKPNALGGRRTHFYADAARGTHFDVLPDGVLISVNQVGFRQRVLGGTITPKKSKWLTIPATAEAHGKRASEFDDLVVVYGAGGRPIALAHAAFRVTRAKLSALPARLRVGVTKTVGAHGGIVFWLRKSVTQAPDPTVAPPRFDLAAGVFGAVNAVLDRATARAARS